MKLSLLASLLALVGCCRAAPHATMSPGLSGPALAADMSGKTVALVVEHDGAWRVYCSGTWISKTEVLTAAHCTKRMLEIAGKPEPEAFISTREDFDGQRARLAHLERRDFSHDLAVLEVVEAPSHLVAALRVDSIEQGEPCFVMGHPVGDEPYPWTFTNGAVSSVRDSGYLSGVRVIQTTAPIWYGNSGGGMFDASGNLMGVASYLDTESFKFGFFIHRDDVRMFVGG